jgi:hypothetical protein
MESQLEGPGRRADADELVWVRGRRARLRGFLPTKDAAVVVYEGERRRRVVRARYVRFTPGDVFRRG